jgi:integrase
MFAEYFGTGKDIIDQFGAGRLANTLTPDDFTKFHAKLASRYGAVGLGNAVQRVRTIFNFSIESEKLEGPMRYGPVFTKPDRKQVKRERREKEKRFLTADEIKALLGAASPQLKAMILLGVNAGLGNTDVANLRMSHIDLKAGILDYTRQKTEVERRAILWPETVAAIEAALKVRPRPALEQHADLVFVTQYGNPWKVTRCGQVEPKSGKLPYTKVDSVGLEFGKLLRRVTVKRDGEEVSLKRPGVNFYALRHVFQTIGSGALDAGAVKRIMGHEDDSVGGRNYMEWMRDEQENARLRKVADHVRAWLYPPETKAKGKGRTPKAKSTPTKPEAWKPRLAG